MKFGTKCIHAGVEPDPSTGAIMTPIFQTSTYVQEAPGKHKGFEYARTQNPTRTVLEENLAALENAKYGRCFSSGMGATDAVIKLLAPGDEVICTHDLYGGTYRLFTTIYQNFGIVFKRVDLKIDNLVYPNFMNVTNTSLNTTIENEFGVKVSTIEQIIPRVYSAMQDQNRPMAILSTWNAVDTPTQNLTRVNLCVEHIKRAGLEAMLVDGYWASDKTHETAIVVFGQRFDPNTPNVELTAQQKANIERNWQYKFILIFIFVDSDISDRYNTGHNYY